MAATMHEDLADEMLDDILSDPAKASGYGALRKNLRNGAISQTEIDIIGQIHRAPSPRHWPERQIAAYAYVNSLIMNGSIATAWFRVGATPGPDADREGNQDKLNNLTGNVQAEVDMAQNGGDQDGILRWSQPVRAAKCTEATFHVPGSQAEPVLMPCSLSPRAIPLEIGSTMPSRTMLHLLLDGAVARWPYGSEAGCVLVNVKAREMRQRANDLIPRCHSLAA